MLTGHQSEQIQSALLGAFSEDDLRAMVLFKLNEHLDEISTRGNLSVVTLDLISWADRNNRVFELINCAIAANPRNALLAALREQATSWHLEPAEQSEVEPYKGLAPFDEKDAPFFFGRKNQTSELISYLRDHRFLAVTGASGSGKSSIVRAGVIPAIKNGAIEGSKEWLVEVINPTNHPLKELSAKLTKDNESVMAQATLMDDMVRDPRSLDLYVSRLTAGRRAEERRLFLVIDQFEELFTLCEDRCERRAFVDNLLCAAAQDGVTNVVITLRADFYHRCAEFDNLRIAIQDHQRYIGSMSREELREAIEEPARIGNWDYEANLVDVILGDISEQPGGLPLLSEALFETWIRRSGRTMTFAAYHDAGGVQGAIARKAENVFSSLTPEQQSIARSIFLRLTLVNEDAEATRRRVPLEELLGCGERPEETELVLSRLEDKRLVTAARSLVRVDGAAQEIVYVNVAHEALIRNWRDLRRWVEESRAELLSLRQLESDARVWGKEQDASFLYRGARLKQLQQITKTRWADITPVERNFLSASLHAQRNQHLRILFTVTALVIVVASAVAGIVFRREILYLLYRPIPAEVVEIQQGSFVMGSTETEIEAAQALGQLEISATCAGMEGTPFMIVLDQEVPSHTVYLDAFSIDRLEVSNKAYHQCELAERCSSRITNGDKNLDGDNLPVVLVSYNDAKNYCEWVGGDLPSEAQWEKAARGPYGERYFPWGDEPDPDRANVCRDWGLVPTNTYAMDGRSFYGLANMSGNVWEWTRDWYDEDYYSKLDSSSRNPLGPSISPNNYRAVRGGSYQDNWIYARTTFRQGRAPDQAYSDVGFRCVYALENFQ